MATLLISYKIVALTIETVSGIWTTPLEPEIGASCPISGETENLVRTPCCKATINEEALLRLRLSDMEKEKPETCCPFCKAIAFEDPVDPSKRESFGISRQAAQKTLTAEAEAVRNKILPEKIAEVHTKYHDQYETVGAIATAARDIADRLTLPNETIEMVFPDRVRLYANYVAEVKFQEFITAMPVHVFEDRETLFKADIQSQGPGITRLETAIILEGFRAQTKDYFTGAFCETFKAKFCEKIADFVADRILKIKSAAAF